MHGCTDSNANNYLPIANVDSGGCVHPVYGCTIERMLNYDSTATVLQGWPRRSDAPTACGNYAPTANTDSGTCTYPIEGCTIQDALTTFTGNHQRWLHSECLCTDGNAYNFASDAAATTRVSTTFMGAWHRKRATTTPSQRWTTGRAW